MGDERETAGRRHTNWDLLGVSLLGVALLSAGLLDVRSYLHHRNDHRPDFAFLEAATGERTGGIELYRGKQAVALLDNVADLESNQTARFRHAQGPRSTILLWTERPRALLNLRFDNTVAGQEITVRCNGRAIEQMVHPPEAVLVREYALDFLPGRNEITFDFALYNHAGVELSSGDSRPLAGTFTQLDLTLQ